jgi:hypothetical protein
MTFSKAYRISSIWNKKHGMTCYVEDGQACSVYSYMHVSCFFEVLLRYTAQFLAILLFTFTT